MTLTKAKIKKGYDRAVVIHQEHLAMDGVKLPKWDTAKSYWLGILMHHSPKAVNKNDIAENVKQFKPELSGDQQVRHLKRDGWNLTGDHGHHAIVDPYKAHSGYTRQQHKSLRTITAKSFDSLKEIHGNKCLTCGAREGEPDPRYGDAPIKLQEGHKDPSLPLNMANTIPQCENCNRTYKDDFTFDDKGRVRAVASPHPVLRASKEVKKQIVEALGGVELNI